MNYLRMTTLAGVMVAVVMAAGAWNCASGAGVPVRLSPLLRAEVVGGRLCLEWKNANSRTSSSQSKQRGSEQSMVEISDAEGAVHLQHRKISEKEMVELECRHGSQIRLFIIQRTEKRYLKFSQIPGHVIRLETGPLTSAMEEKLKGDVMEISFQEETSPDARVFTVTSLWEAWIFGEEALQEALQEALEILLRPKSVAEFRTIFAETMMRSALDEVRLDNLDEVREWIEALDHEQFAVRNAAMRKLRRVGPPLMFLLEDLGWDSFSPEQQLRLVAIVEEMDVRYGRESEQLFAARWQESPRAWFWALGSESLESRAFAWQKLCALRQTDPEKFAESSGSGVVAEFGQAFTPEAPQKDRDAQLGTLRLLIQE